MVRIVSAALLSAMLALANAAGMSTPVKAQVGQLLTLSWELPAGVWPDRLTLQHGNGANGYTCVGCQALVYETLVQWTDASGRNNKGEGYTSIDWIPNVPGPAFYLQLVGTDDRNYGSSLFQILAADGSEVKVAIGGDHFSNIMPQTATPIWYPNDPHKTSSPETTAASPTGTSTTKAAPTTVSTSSTAPIHPDPSSTATHMEPIHANSTCTKCHASEASSTTLIPKPTASANEHDSTVYMTVCVAATTAPHNTLSTIAPSKTPATNTTKTNATTSSPSLAKYTGASSAMSVSAMVVLGALGLTAFMSL